MRTAIAVLLGLALGAGSRAEANVVCIRRRRMGGQMRPKATTGVLLALILCPTPSHAALSASARRAIRCSQAKLRAVKRKTDAKLACQAIAVRRNTAINPVCLANAEAAFLRAFAKAEARGGCFNPNGNSASRVEGAIDSFIGDTGNLLMPCTPSISGTPCGPEDCRGRLTLCLPDVSGAPVCADTSACRSGTCTSDVTCEVGRACVPVLGVNRCCDICQ